MFKKKKSAAPVKKGHDSSDEEESDGDDVDDSNNKETEDVDNDDDDEDSDDDHDDDEEEDDDDDDSDDDSDDDDDDDDDDDSDDDDDDNDDDDDDSDDDDEGDVEDKEDTKNLTEGDDDGDDDDDDDGSDKDGADVGRRGAAAAKGKANRARFDNDDSDDDEDDEMDRLFAEGEEEEGGEEDEEELAANVEDRVASKLLQQVEQYDAVPPDTVSFGTMLFWDERYSAELEPFEWYQPWENLAPSLCQYVSPDDNILMCGCGSSLLSPAMYDDGYEHIMNVDFSRVVIDQMQDMFPDTDFPGMEWKSRDLTFTDFKPESFDVAIDKGCLDSILCSIDGTVRVKKYLQEMDRLLSEEGAFICISYASPDGRLPWLENFDLETRPLEALAWDVHVDAIAKPTVKPFHIPNLKNPDEMYYIYVCIKDPVKVARKEWAKEKRQKQQEAQIKKLTSGLKRRMPGRGRGR